MSSLDASHPTETIHLRGSLTIHSIESHYRRLKELSLELVPAHPIQISLERVEDIDMAGIQTLVAFKQSHKNNAIRFVVSDSVQRHLRLAGVENYLLEEETA